MSCSGPWIVPQGIEKALKNYYLPVQTAQIQVLEHTYTLYRGEGYIHECIYGSWLLCVVIESLFLLSLLHQITMASFSLQTFLLHQLYMGTPMIIFLVSVTHNPFKRECTLLKNPGSWNGEDNRTVKQVQPSQTATAFSLSLPSLRWTFSFSAQPTCR